MTLSPFLTAYSMPSTASDVEPLPLEFMNLIGTTLVDQQMPATPKELLPRPPTMPATWLPWPLSSSTRALPLDRVVAVGVVHEAVLVVVLAVVRLVAALVDVVLQVGVIGVDPGVQDPDLRARGARAPGGGRVDVVVLAAVYHRPVARVIGVVGRLDRGGELEVVRLRVRHVRMGSQAAKQDLGGKPGARADHHEPSSPDLVEALGDAPLERCKDVSLATLRHPLVEAHEQAAGRSRRRRRCRRGKDQGDQAGGRGES